MINLVFIAIITTSCCILLPTCSCVTLPLSVVKDQIVDQNGEIFQFRCTNWAGHMESNLPEGLQHQPLSHIIDLISSSSAFNCVRLNYAVELISKTAMTARESLMSSLGGYLASHVLPFQQHNPELIDLPLPAVFQAVVGALAERGLVVLVSIHVSLLIRIRLLLFSYSI
jgi:endoglucanase